MRKKYSVSVLSLSLCRLSLSLSLLLSIYLSVCLSVCLSRETRTLNLLPCACGSISRTKEKEGPAAEESHIMGGCAGLTQRGPGWPTVSVRTVVAAAPLPQCEPQCDAVRLRQRESGRELRQVRSLG